MGEAGTLGHNAGQSMSMPASRLSDALSAIHADRSPTFLRMSRWQAAGLDSVVHIEDRGAHGSLAGINSSFGVSPSPAPIRDQYAGEISSSLAKSLKLDFLLFALLADVRAECHFLT